MYKKIISVCINCLFGAVMCPIIMCVIMINEGWFFTGKELLKFLIITFICIGLCIYYNAKRYQKMINGLLNYNKKVFHLTLWIPLFFWYFGIFIVYLMDMPHY